MVKGIFFLLLLTSCLSSPAYSQEKTDTIVMPVEEQGSARIDFEQQVYDFGEFSKSKHPKQKHKFKFKNNGGKNLYILQIITGCGCTTPEYTKEPIKPGDTGVVTVTFDAASQRKGKFTKSITVYTNDPRSFVRIFIKGKIEE